MSKKTPSFSKVLESLVRPTTIEYDSKLGTIVKRILGHVIIFLLVVGGIVIMYLDPLSFLTCRHVETKQIDCNLQERIAWLIPVRETLIARVREAYVNQELVTGEDDDGKAYSYYAYEVILVSASGETGLTGTDQIGLSAKLTANRINDYLNTPTSEPLTVWGHGLWGHSLITLVGGLVFIFFGFLFVTTFVNTVLLFGAWVVEFVLLVVGWVVARIGHSPEVNDQINRFRRAVRGIAIRPDH